MSTQRPISGIPFQLSLVPIASQEYIISSTRLPENFIFYPLILITYKLDPTFIQIKTCNRLHSTMPAQKPIKWVIQSAGKHKNIRPAQPKAKKLRNVRLAVSQLTFQMTKGFVETKTTSPEPRYQPEPKLQNKSISTGTPLRTPHRSGNSSPPSKKQQSLHSIATNRAFLKRNVRGNMGSPICTQVHQIRCIMEMCQDQKWEQDLDRRTHASVELLIEQCDDAEKLWSKGDEARFQKKLPLVVMNFDKTYKMVEKDMKRAGAQRANMWGEQVRKWK